MKYLLALLLSLLASPALAGVSCVLPFNIQNGQPADATQVMANYNALVACLGNAAAAGANSDITSLSGITTPIPKSAGGTPVYIGGTSTGSANAQVVASTVPTFIASPGNIVTFQAGFNNTGPMTLNAQSTGSFNVFRHTQLGPVAMVGGEIVAGDEVIAQYDGTQFQCLSCHKDVVGELMDFAGVTVPQGWLAADGSCVAQATYNALFNVIGTTYNALSGCSGGNFGLPDGRGIVMVGLDNQGTSGNANRLSLCGNHLTLGGFCGGQSQVIAQANLPAVNLSLAGVTATDAGHTHPTLDGSNFFTSHVGGSVGSAVASASVNTPTTGTGFANVTIGGTLPLGGSGVGLQTIQPAQVVYKIIKL
jgi:microcystin-dependent protein